MGRSTLAHLVILQAVALGIIAVASTAGAMDHDRNPAGLMRQEARDSAKINIRGNLKCPMPESNDGTACNLQIVDGETGKTLRIVASGLAMRLYQSGQTQVVATGTVMGDALRIIEIRAE